MRKTHLDLLSLPASALLAADSVLSVQQILSAVNKSMSGRNVRPVRYIVEAGYFGGRGSKKHAGDGSMVSYSARFQEV